MADQRFFKNEGPFTLDEMASRCGAVLYRADEGGKTVADVAALADAGPDHLAFLDNVKYKDAFKASRAGACIVAEKMVEDAPQGMALLVSKNPYRSYALAAAMFYPGSLPHYRHADDDPDFGGVSPRAVIHASACVGANCVIGPNVVIERQVKIGAGCIIEANTVIGPGVEIGEACHIGNNCSISHAVIGRGVRLHNGVRIGQDGFGFALDPAGFIPVPQLGRVMVGNGANIGANTTIDRGAGPDTVIGDGAIIDNLVQLGHNVQVGKGCVIVAQVGISGSTKIGAYSMIGGQAGLAGHLEIGQAVKIGAQSGVSKSIPDGMEVMGTPAQEKRRHWKELATLKRLSERKIKD